MPSPILVYGANGFTGRLATDALCERGLEPILCGRSAHAVGPAAERRGLRARTASLHDPDALDRALEGIEVVLHCAGPFSTTARPMIDACLRRRVHYLDVAGEVLVLEATAARGAEARSRGVMLMPGAGFDVVPSDALAAHVKRRLPGAQRLRLAMTGLDFASHGSARTLLEHADRVIWVRSAGRLTRVPILSDLPRFDFGAGERPTVNVSWGDVATAYYTTGIPDIRVYFESTPALQLLAVAGRVLGPVLRTGPAQAWMKAHVSLLPSERSAEERAKRRMGIVAEAIAPDGERVRSRLRTPEAYSFTGVVAAELAARVLAGDLEPGFQTPARVYGPDLVLDFRGVEREDVDA